MLLSQLLGERFREKPGDAFLPSHIFMVRGGYIRQVAGGIFTLLTPARRACQNIERIIREEMDGMGGQEVLFPVVLPGELWQESGRYEAVGSELLRFTDRGGHPMVLGMTHEEAAVQLARGEARSHAKYPFMIYQIQTKFRDEPRARGGLIRVREFTMKDAYSFHTSQEDLQAYYTRMLACYRRIFRRVGLGEVVDIGSDSGMMGGGVAHEFMYLSEGGEDTLVLCDACGYRANQEVAVRGREPWTGGERALERVHTPGVTDIASLAVFLGIPASGTMKAAVFARAGSSLPLIAFIRGDLTVDESKLRRFAGEEVTPYTGEELCLGYVGPLDPGEAEVVLDESLRGAPDLVCGANERDTHLRGLSVPRDLPRARFADLARVEEGDRCPHCGAPLRLSRGIEVGNIFQLGDKYTRSMGMTYVDAEGERRIPIMGCYGIGVGRLLACVAEAHHDEHGPVWPLSVAPWKVHICALKGGEQAARTLYDKLNQRYAGNVLLDDRGLTPGVQFADADLLGAPLRIVAGSRCLAQGGLELVARDGSFREVVPLAALEQRIDDCLREGACQ